MGKLKGMKAGFAGLGFMGGHMARNLLQAGVDLQLYNRTRAKTEALEAEGASVAATPAEMAEAVGDGVMIVCVTDTPAMEAIVAGSDDTPGLIAGLRPGALIIDMGTSRIETTRVLAERMAVRGAGFMDAPVSGGEVGARDGRLTIMAGGSESDFARAVPYFEVLGRSHTHIGPVGAGQVAKCANQTIVALTLTAVAEALVFAEKGGADPARTREALLGGFAGSRILELHGRRMIDNAFEPGGRARTQLKDLEQTLEFASEVGIRMPLLERDTELWREMVERGWGDLDQSGIMMLTRALSED